MLVVSTYDLFVKSVGEFEESDLIRDETRLRDQQEDPPLFLL